MREEEREKVYRLKKVSSPDLEKYESEYNQYVHMFRKACDESRDICISRIPGEEYSLMVEVVRSRNVKLLFDKFSVTQQLGYHLSASLKIA